ncbi:hypothetical protein ACQAYK_08965 [Acidithiobacillus sp. AC3]
MKYPTKQRTAGDVAAQYLARLERIQARLEKAREEYQFALFLNAMTQRRAKLAISIARALKEETHGIL